MIAEYRLNPTLVANEHSEESTIIMLDLIVVHLLRCYLY